MTDAKLLLTAQTQAQALLNHSSQSDSDLNIVRYHAEKRVILLGQHPAGSQLVGALIQAGYELTPVEGSNISVRGHLGAFDVEWTTAIGVSKHKHGDIVLDCTHPPTLSSAVLPPGYLVAGQEEIPADILELVEQHIGDFSKPKFFVYDPDICAHGSAKLAGCNACIHACPADAIISIGEKIEVNPMLCQGGGTCATACPTGAIRYNFPQPSQQADRLRKAIRAYKIAANQMPHVLIYSGDWDLSSLDPRIIAVEVEETASLGAAFWLQALAFGAASVVISAEADIPAVSLEILKTQLEFARGVLSAMNYPSEAISIRPDIKPDLKISMPPIAPSNALGTNLKREQLWAAIDHLWHEAAHPSASLKEPAGGQFGFVSINTESCTFCMACLNVCPTQSLSGGDHPIIQFDHRQCVQCGLCDQACPENAIELNSELILDPVSRSEKRTLNEDKIHHCPRCNAPFASGSMIDKMLASLASHSMYQDPRALERLKMCGDCRVIDAVEQHEHLEKLL
ncbi:MAG: 4Fe-4S binding protein [Gammaproteobacteria bacterium]|nr:4Fe-4S binding protein [Gammaproteobacteria bacterium]